MAATILNPLSSSLLTSLAAGVAAEGAGGLRIADALDYTHTGVVGNLAVAVKKHKVIIAVQCSGDCSAEMERVIKKGDLFMHVFGRELECVCQEN